MGFWSGLSTPRNEAVGAPCAPRGLRIFQVSIGFSHFITFLIRCEPCWPGFYLMQATLQLDIVARLQLCSSTPAWWWPVLHPMLAGSDGRLQIFVYIYILIGWSHPFQCRYITQTGGQKDQPLQELHRNNPWHSPWICPFLSAPRLWARAISLPDLGGVCSRCCGTGRLQSKAVLNTTKFGSQMFLGQWRCAGFHGGRDLSVQRFAEISGRRWVQLW